MTAYRTGTVSIPNGSTTVTGTGTAFVANVRAGQALQIGQVFLEEIVAVVSDTELTIGGANTGGTLTNQAYVVLPIPGDQKTLSQSVMSLITDYTDVKNKAGAGKFADGTAAAPGIRFETDQDSGFFRKGANQIGISLGGVEVGYLDGATNTLKGALLQSSLTDATAGKLMTPGAFGLGGTAVLFYGDVDDPTLPTGRYFAEGSSTGTKPKSFGFFQVDRRTAGDRATQTWWSDAGLIYTRVYASSAWTAWRELYHQGNILGTVSQTTGTPTGAIIQRGSNANGEYVRFADGTQICTHELTTSATDGVLWTFPAVFSAAPNGTFCTAAANSARITTSRAASGTGLTVDGWTTAAARVAVLTSVCAIGTWF